MSAKSSKEQGFSTVELLISLFIAAAFIGTGFQLFSAVIQDGNEARLRSRAGNIVSTALRERANGAPVPCMSEPAAEVFAISTDDLPAAEGTYAYTCPYGIGSRTTRVTVTVEYGTPPKTVRGSLDVSR